MQKKKPVIRFDRHGRELGGHPDPLVDMDPGAPITHARVGTGKSTLVDTGESTLAFHPARSQEVRIPDFEKKVRHLLKRGRN
ncbi:MAG: hypothetical protein M3P06_00265 [Acidobacteriota bacterium]|nr:hypothetical protein [Acidobacteriota bacterium]